jgi:hypothetical protein
MWSFFILIIPVVPAVICVGEEFGIIEGGAKFIGTGGIAYY